MDLQVVYNDLEKLETLIQTKMRLNHWTNAMNRLCSEESEEFNIEAAVNPIGVTLITV